MPEGAFNTSFRPVAEPGQVVNLLPREQLYEVEKLEQLPDLGPFDFGEVGAGGQAVDADGQVQQELEDLELRSDHLGQFRMEIVSPVEVEVNQPGRQNQRFKTVNIRGSFTTDTPSHLSEFYVFGDDVPYFIVENPNPFDLQQSLVQIRGYRIWLDGPVGENQLRGRTPANVPTGQLSERAQRV